MTDLTRRDLFGVAAGLPILVGSHFRHAPAEPASQPPTSFAPRIIKAPGKNYATSVRRFVAEFRNRFKTSTPYPIARAFQILPFNVIKDGVAEQLIARGMVAFKNGTCTNTGEYVEAEFNDANFGTMTVVFDETIGAAISEPSPEILDVSFKAAPVVVMFHNIDPSYRVASNQRVERISFEPKVVKYFLFEALEPRRRTELHVDLTATDIPVAQLASLRISEAGFAMQEPICRCDCCGKEICSPACPPTDGTTNKPKPPVYTDLKADRCIYLNNLNRYTAFFTGNVFGITSDYTAPEYIGKKMSIQSTGFDCKASIYGKAVGAATINILQITYNETYPPNSPTIKSTVVYGSPA